MKVYWEVDDGAERQTRTTTIDDSKFDDCKTEEERKAVVFEAVQYDFDQWKTYLTYDVIRKEE